MKKRVRIYKAQQGGVPQQKQISETELMDMTYKLLTAGSEPQEVLTSLVSSGVQQDLANRAISSVVEYINDEQAKMDADRNQDMDAKEDLMAEEQADQDEAMRQAEYDSRQKAMQEMYYGEYEEDPGAEAEEDAVVDDLIMKTGGKMPSKRTFVRNYIKQVGGVQEDPGIESSGTKSKTRNKVRNQLQGYGLGGFFHERWRSQWRTRALFNRYEEANVENIGGLGHARPDGPIVQSDAQWQQRSCHY